jgi:hypothetical protein
MKPGTVDMVTLVRPGKAQQHVTLPAFKSGAPPRDIRISSDAAPDLFLKKESQELGEARSEDKQVVIQVRDNSAANEPVSVVHDRASRATLALNFARGELDAYVAYRSEAQIANRGRAANA